MKGFRVLAIRPLKGTSTRFIKNLQPQVIYKFYQQFRFCDEKGIDVMYENHNLETITVYPKFPETPDIQLYSSKKLNINVSAIVGQNGSGKSTIIDFYDTIIYYLSCHEIGKMTPTPEQVLSKLKFLVHFIKEYLVQVQNYTETNPFEKNIDLSKPTELLNDLELQEIANNLISIFEMRNQLYSSEIKNLDTNQKLIAFHEILWRYSIEGRKNYELKINFSLYQIQYVYQELNIAIIKKLKELLSQFKKENEFERQLKEEFNFQLFYQIDENIYCLEKIGKNVSKPSTPFFYTILLNYSLHSMNSEHLGEWIFKLFHKNDGYQTPIVINPYREYGEINVNSELELSTDRLIYDIVDQYRSKDSATTLNKYHFKKIILKLKSKSAYPLEYLKEEAIDYLDKAKLLDFLSTNPFKLESQKNIGILDICMSYLIKKFQKISRTYMEHFYEKKDLTEKELSKQIDELQKWQILQAKEFILTSNSHVTRKFDQTYNFIINYDQLKKNLDFLNYWDFYQDIEISGEQLEDWINLIEDIFELKSKGTHEIITHLFPAIFKVDIEFEKNDAPIKLSDMSSGEQQYLFNINTVTYHINNLKTIKPVEGGKMSKYNHINIILDEIELYYHPQYQKQLVKDLIEEIKSIDSLGELCNFNIQFLTHSPFILSDIPTNNILRLNLNNEGKSEPQLVNEQTFGANIHDLLANDFFLKKGFMGEFAKDIISDIALSLTRDEDNDEIPRRDWQPKEILEFIQLIGEPILRERLYSLYNRKYNSDERQKLELELKRIQKKLDKLNDSK